MKTPKADTKTPKVETKMPVVVPVDNGEHSEEVEITSSGRRRTRPSKFNETTYADVKSKTPVENNGKRKRGEVKEPDCDKKKAKSELTPVKVELMSAGSDNPGPESTPNSQTSSVKISTRASTGVAKTAKSEAKTEVSAKTEVTP